MNSTLHHDDALRRLGSDLTLGLLDLRSFRREVTALLRRRFDCEQVLLWRLDGGDSEQPNTRRLSCTAERYADALVLDPPHRIDEADVADYLRHLACNGVYSSPVGDAEDTQAGRFHPQGDADGASLLHAGAMFNGRFLGIVCCGQRGGREWSASDKVELQRLATRIALYVGNVPGYFAEPAAEAGNADASSLEIEP
jgi:GAF domain-containing protein